MSRVDKAMRRAGEQEQTGAPLGDETAFEMREELGSSPAAQQPAAEEHVTSPAEGTFRAGALSPRPPLVPIQMSRSERTDDVQILDVIRVLLSRWKLITAVVASAVALAVLYNQLATPRYQARAQLLIEPDSPNVVPFRPLTEDTARYDYFLTQFEVLRSRALARLALERLGVLGADPESQQDQIDAFLANVRVSPVRSDAGESRVVNVTFASTDPQRAARSANALAQAYVAHNLDARRKKSHEAAAWLKDRLAELREQVQSTEGALQRYRERSDAVSAGDQQNIIVQKLAQLNTAVTTARAEKVERETLYQQLNALQERGASPDTFPPILSNPVIQGLKTDLAALQRERLGLAQKFGELHPEMIKAEAAIAAAERRLNAETLKVVEGIRNDFRTAEARERGLLAALNDQKGEVLEMNRKSIGYDALQREASSTRQIYESVLQRIKETELSGELQVNNASILDAAQVPVTPYLPRTRLNLLIALFLGGFVAVGSALGLEFLNPRVSRPEDVRDSLGLPLLGIAPDFRASNGSHDVENLPEEFQEAVRAIRTRILLDNSAPRALAVTSTESGEGKTAIASGLAASMAKAGRRVLLVDADMRRSRMHKVFGVAASPGLSNIMAGTAKPSEALFETSLKGLYVLPAGAGVANPSDLLDKDRLVTLIQGFTQVFDVIVLDCPPLMALADASIIANAASAVVFVIKSGTNRGRARVAVERLRAVQAEVMGVVLNKAKIDRLSGYHYPYYKSDNIAQTHAG